MHLGFKRYVLGVSDGDYTVWDNIEGIIIERVEIKAIISLETIPEFFEKVRSMNCDYDELSAYTKEILEYING